MNNCKVSVIVPVYNVEKYLENCIKTVISQTYTNLEIILVDDGATDSSGTICDRFAEEDYRIKVIHQANAGLSAARNAGLEIASGEYIFFVDSDDFIDLNTIEMLINKAQIGNYDITACGIEMVWDDETKNSSFTSKGAAEWSGRDSVLEMMHTNNVCSVVWNKLYRKSLWQDIRYPVGKIHEDEFTTYKLLYRAKSVAFIPDMLYKYYQRESGLSAGKTRDDRDDHLIAFYERYEYFKALGEDEIAEWSMIYYLEYIKFLYRNAGSSERKLSLVERFNKSASLILKYKHIPASKKLTILGWRIYKY